MTILSLQSMVTFGHVGHSAAQYPLQCMGRTYWAIPTVYLSHHKAYPHWSGLELTTSQMVGMAQSLAANGHLKQVRAFLIGYLGTADAVEAASQIIHLLKQEKPDAYIILDPVIGDHHSGFYVPENVRHGMIENILPQANVLTPNSFEWDHLKNYHSGQDIIITGIENTERPDQIGMRYYSITDQVDVWTRHFTLSRPPSGSGDLTAALITGFLLDGHPLKEALFKTAPIMEKVFQHTYETGASDLAVTELGQEFLKQHID